MMLRRDADLASLERVRDEIASHMIASSVLPAQRTFAVGVIAEAFLDRLLVAFDRASYLELLAWLDATCESHAHSPQIGSMLASAARSILATVHANGPASNELDAEIMSLEPSIGSIAFKPRKGATANGDPLADETSRVIHAMLSQMEESDPLTFEHSHAVSLWCARIARRLSLSESEVSHAARCGLVHDLGKMKIATTILHAPRALSADEWAVIREHPALGEEIARGAQPLRPFAGTIRSHHERLDGRGYPDGLAGSQISLATRIVTVADAFNAMIGRRPYRLPMAPGNALDQLSHYRGTQFDPIVVEAMIDVVSHTEPR